MLNYFTKNFAKVLILSYIVITSVICINSCATNESQQKGMLMTIGKVDDIKVEPISYHRQNGIIHGVATIVNTSLRNGQNVYYRCHFYDSDGVDLSANAPWNPLLLYAGQAQTISCHAINVTAVGFKLELSSTGKSNKVYTTRN